LHRHDLLRGPVRLGLLLVGLGLRQGHGRKPDLRDGLHGQHGMPVGLAVLRDAVRQQQRLPRERARDRSDLLVPGWAHLLRFGLLPGWADLL